MIRCKYFASRIKVHMNIREAFKKKSLTFVNLSYFSHSKFFTTVTGGLCDKPIQSTIFHLNIFSKIFPC